MLILIILVLLVISVLGITWYTYFTCFFASKNRHENPYAPLDGSQYRAVADEIYACSRIMEKSECQWVSIRSYDGLLLKGRYYHHAQNAPLMILFHGYRGMALRDCSGGFILAGKLGMNVLVPDQRAHGQSEGRTITFGIKERFDVLSWIHFCNTTFGKKNIILSGLSMGAATVLMAGGEELPDNVLGIIADSGFSSPKEIIYKVCCDKKLPSKLCYHFIALGARLFGGFSLVDCEAKEAVSHTTLPILLLHGDDDRYVPAEMSKEIFHVRPDNTTLVLFRNAGHGLCYMVDPNLYEKANVDFLWNIQALQPYLETNDFAISIHSKTNL